MVTRVVPGALPAPACTRPMAVPPLHQLHTPLQQYGGFMHWRCVRRKGGGGSLRRTSSQAKAYDRLWGYEVLSKLALQLRVTVIEEFQRRHRPVRLHLGPLSYARSAF